MRVPNLLIEFFLAAVLLQAVSTSIVLAITAPIPTAVAAVALLGAVRLLKTEYGLCNVSMDCVYVTKPKEKNKKRKKMSHHLVCQHSLSTVLTHTLKCALLCLR